MNKVKREMLEEGWRKFIRIHYDDIYVDLFSDDTLVNPNSDRRSDLKLNTNTVWIRPEYSKTWHPLKFESKKLVPVFHNTEVLSVASILETYFYNNSIVCIENPTNFQIYLASYEEFNYLYENLSLLHNEYEKFEIAEPSFCSKIIDNKFLYILYAIEEDQIKETFDFFLEKILESYSLCGGEEEPTLFIPPQFNIHELRPRIREIMINLNLENLNIIQ